MVKCFTICLSEHKRDLKSINMGRLKANESNKKNCIS